MIARVPFDPALLANFCRKHRVRRLSLFGSALRPDFEESSHIGVLVEFERGHIPGLAFFAMESDLSRILGRSVDLNTRHFLSPHFRGEVEAEAQEIYVAP